MFWVIKTSCLSSKTGTNYKYSGIFYLLFYFLISVTHTCRSTHVNTQTDLNTLLLNHSSFSSVRTHSLSPIGVSNTHSRTHTLQLAHGLGVCPVWNTTCLSALTDLFILWTLAGLRLSQFLAQSPVVATRGVLDVKVGRYKNTLVTPFLVFDI